SLARLSCSPHASFPASTSSTASPTTKSRLSHLFIAHMLYRKPAICNPLPDPSIGSAAMCGICGLLALDGSAVDATPLAAMSETLRHRGPDSEGSVVDGPVALAARR